MSRPTVADIEAHAQQLVDELRPYMDEVRDRIVETVADCEAHGLKAVTRTLRDKADGRPTVRHAMRNPSLRAAMRKLDELLDWACGPSSASSHGRFRDIRHAAYESGYAFWRRWVPDSVAHHADPQESGCHACRTFPIHGMDPRTDFGATIMRARRTFGAAVARAGISGMTDVDVRMILGEWRRRSEADILKHASRILSDGQTFADNRAVKDAVHPDYRMED